MGRIFHSENEHLQFGLQYLELCTCRYKFYLFTFKPKFWPLVTPPPPPPNLSWCFFWNIKRYKVVNFIFWFSFPIRALLCYSRYRSHLVVFAVNGLPSILSSVTSVPLPAFSSKLSDVWPDPSLPLFPSLTQTWSLLSPCPQKTPALGLRVFYQVILELTENVFSIYPSRLF